MSPPAEKTEIQTFFGRCRCCLSYGYLKNMWSEHEFEGETEIYGEMLVQCFALTWDHTQVSQETMAQDQICDQCICRLRDAVDFKKVVLNAQEEILQIDSEKSVKEEVLDVEYLEESGDNEGDANTEYISYTGAALDDVKDEVEFEEIEFLEEADDGVTFEVNDHSEDSSQMSEASQPKQELRPVKRRKQPVTYKLDEDGNPIHKWPKKLPKGERHLTYKQYTEEDLRNCLEEIRNEELTPAEAAIKYNIPKKTVCAKLKCEPKDVRTDIRPTYHGSAHKNVTTQSKITRFFQDPDNIHQIGKKEDSRDIMLKHKHNLKMILKYSNATMIKGNSAAGYSCSFCDKHFTPENLKRHNFEHGDIFDDAVKVKYLADLIIKLDITGLECSICDTDIDSLKDLMEHLKEDHNRTIHTDIANHFIPFKFDTETLQCVICCKEFRYFKLLSEHMCEHYRNYECSVCHRPFINKQSMKAHSYRHRKGEYQCSFCPKVFDNKLKLTEHERITHILSNKRRKCLYCNDKFSSDSALKSHQIKKHGMTPKFKCEACGKLCNSQKDLTLHKRRVHLLMRPFQCGDCPKSFFTRQELQCHSVIHTQVRNYHCDLCENSFGTSSALNQHMRAHLGDRKYKCDYCGLQFVHLSTWRKHLLTQHGVVAGSTRNKF